MATQQQSPSSPSIDGAAGLLVSKLLVAYVLLPALVLLLGGNALFKHLRRRQSRSDVEQNGSKLPELARSGGASGESGSSPMLDVWAERQRRGIGPATSSTRSRDEEGSGDKPFGSKYYYAHNNPNATGGYKDGLRMEDYTMNGPRLLARNGVTVPSRPDNEGAASEAYAAAGEASAGRDPVEQGAGSVKKAKKRVLLVTQYLWDDPGKGTGTIRVDQLPHPAKPGEKRSWKDSRIENVQACLVSGDCGLEVVMESTDGDSLGILEYRLCIPKLYGPVSAVSTVTKPTRLLIKLEKRTTLLDRSNAKPWPHPQKKLL